MSDFEADNENVNSSLSNETTDIYKQIARCNGYFKLSELQDVLKILYYNSNLDYDFLDWFVNEVINLENKKAFYFKNTEEDFKKTEEIEEVFFK